MKEFTSKPHTQCVVCRIPVNSTCCSKIACIKEVKKRQEDFHNTLRDRKRNTPENF